MHERVAICRFERMCKSAFRFALFGFLTVSAMAQGADIWGDLEKGLQSSSSVVPAVSSSSDLASSSSVAVSSSSTILASSSSIAVVAIPAVVPTSSSSVAMLSSSSQADSSATILPSDTSGANAIPLPMQVPSSSSVQSSSSSAIVTTVPAPAAMSRKDLLGPVRVSRVNGIDEMKGRYRSPRRALFMSLLVPGSGQIYVGGSTFNYVRGVTYLAIEASLISGWYYYTVYKYDDQVKKYKQFARDHYSVGKYENNMHDLWNQLDDGTQESLFRTLYGSSRQEYCQSLYGDAARFGCYANDSTFINDAAHVANFDTLTLASSPIKTKFFDEGGFYRVISGTDFVLGWDDADSMRTVGELQISSADNYSYVNLGYSANRLKYISQRQRATDLADMQAWFFGGLILNHLVSAIDATLAARSHNMALYEERMTWFDKMRLDSRVGMQDGFSASVNALWGF